MPIGGIYSEQKCPVCGEILRDNKKNAVDCRKHPQCRATDFDVRIRGIHITCHSYQQASDVLTGLRFKAKERSLDERDYKRDAPLGFSNLSQSYLEFKKKKKSYNKMRWHLGYASDYFHNKNIKEISEGDLDDLYICLPERLTEKTKKNIFITLHAFFVWVKRRERKQNPNFAIPEFIKIEFESPYRRIVDKETQLDILEEVKRLTYDLNPRIYIACLWLTTYSHIRGVELLNVQVKDIDLRAGRIEVYRTKENKPKLIELIQEDIDYLKSLPAEFPELYFFRHLKKMPGLPYSKVGTKFGDALLNSWWKIACKNLGVEGVPLYPGTRHSTLTDINEKYGYEAAQDQSGHTTREALKRYLVRNRDSKKALYSYARRGKEKVKDFYPSPGNKVVDIIDKR